MADDFKHLVRIASTDLDGAKPVYYALTQIKGINFRLSEAICKVAGVDRVATIGKLPDAQVKKLDEAVKHPAKAGIPVWMLNRKRDPESGQDRHLLVAELDFEKDNDIKRMKMIRSYRGLRHMFGYPVRVQRTRSNFRKNKGKVMGVKRAKTAGKT